jgi:DNA-directed RNA polymerase delta subunit
VAYDYDIPLFNFWSAAQFLSNQGLDPSRDNIYMTTEAWDLRNYYALKTLDAIRQALEQIPLPSR